MQYFGRQEEAMDQDIQFVSPLLSYAQQVSFPNWNVMVGDLGQKFARRNSFDRGIVDDEKDIFNTDKDSGGNKPSEATKTEAISETRVGPKHEKTATSNSNNHFMKSGEDNPPRATENERKPVFRYCEIIKEDSRELEEELEYEKENSAKIHISTVNIVLKRDKGKKQIEGGDNCREYGNNTRKVSDIKQISVESYENIDPFEDEANNFCKKNGVLDTDKVKSTNCMLESNSEMKNMLSDASVKIENEKVSPSSGRKLGVQLGPSEEIRTRKIVRTTAIDDNHLSADSAEMRIPGHHAPCHKHRGRFRKKSSSFSGALPLHFKTSNDDINNQGFLLPSEQTPQPNMRRRGTVDIGRLALQKSPWNARDNRPRKHERKADPSHYLMNGNKRRGSYNPTYDPCSLMTNKPRKNNTRAKSLYVGQHDEKTALRDRLMKHACPELRESIELDDSSDENKSDNEKTTKESRAPSGMNDETNKVKKPLSPSEETWRKISLTKSASQSLISAKHASLNRNRGSWHGKSKDNALETSNEKFSEKFFESSRSTRRKMAMFDNQASANDEHRKNIINSSDATTDDAILATRPNRLNQPKARFMRAQSNFEGVPSMYLGRLRQKSLEHERLGRCRSDSISSASSSDGGDAMDPFPMHNAAKNGKLKRLQQYVANGMSVNARDAEGWPPVHYALSAGHFDCVALLLNAGASVSDYAKGRTSKYFK
eukprot:Seg639.7 transcript_id=Seg639.7/GoldUCD/mRNA.D3Y31 product="Ankyrin repeat domain-containing protein 12" protein_id=Seg639.7/GoldUCD/D3Y31